MGYVAYLSKEERDRGRAAIEKMRRQLRATKGEVLPPEPDHEPESDNMEPDDKWQTRKDLQ